MAAGTDERLDRWVDLVGDLLHSRPAAFPTDIVLDELVRTFGVHASWTWADDDGAFGFTLVAPIPGFPPVERFAQWAGDYAGHPLLRWFAITGDPTAMSTHAVPETMYTDQTRQLMAESLRPYDLQTQLSIPVRIEGPAHRAFLLASPERGFTDQDVLLARQIQPLLRLAARQATELGRRRPAPTHDPTGDLTGRQLAVLQLLERGLTAEAIGRRLGISPRTVHVHVAEVYRRLGVHDRLTAVLVARSAGLLSGLETGGDNPAAAPDHSGRVFAWQPGRGLVLEPGRW